MSASARARLAALDTPNVRRVLAFGALVGVVLGVDTLILHATNDPLADFRAYYEAGARLNAGQPLYVQPASTNQAEFYRYPPLLAIVCRPLALLPYEVAAAIWEVAIVGLFVLTLVRLGVRRRTWLVMGMLALPTAWAVAIGQAQVAVTFFMALGSPWAIAIAANLKLFPALVAIWWVGRRDVHSLSRFALWLVILGAIQLVLEPAGTLAYPGFIGMDQVGQVNNRSLYAVSPVLWFGALVVGTVAALRLAPTRYGWAAAVALSVFATPRLLIYQVSSLAAGTREPTTTADRT